MPKRKKISRLVSADVDIQSMDSSDEAAASAIETGMHLYEADGRKQLEVVFALESGQAERISFSAHLPRRGLCLGLAEAFYNWGVPQTSATRQRRKGYLNKFFLFLSERERRIPSAPKVNSLRQLTTSLINEFIAWLNAPKLHTRGKGKGKQKQWAVKSRALHLSMVAVLLSWLKEIRRDELPNDCEVRFANWPNLEAKPEPTASLTPQQIAQVEKACLLEIENGWAKFQLGQKLLSQHPSEAKPEHRALAGVLHCLVYDLKILDRRVAAKCQLLKRKPWRTAFEEGGFLIGMLAYLRPTARSLVPYAVYIDSRGFFSTEALLGADRSKVLSDHPLFEERKVITLMKGRAGKIQKRSFDSRRSRSIPAMVERVQVMTAPLVPLAGQAPISSRLFLFRPGQGSRAVVAAYIDDDGNLDNHLWTENFRRFREDHGLPYFTLKNLRQTGSDRTHEVSGGDIKASQALLNHMSADTTFGSYNTDAMKRRDAQKIAALQVRFVDWARPDGSADRSTVAADVPDLTPSQQDAIARGENATASGFTCKNPYDSPQPGQRRGQLCSVWLGCFACPNAVVERNPSALARLMQLKDHLVSSRLTVNQARFELIYAPQLTILEKDILPTFIEQSVHQEALALLPSLPPLPDLD
jgi:hypothetical protein